MKKFALSKYLFAFILVFLFSTGNLWAQSGCLNDTQAPTIVCAAPVTINTTPGLCTGTTTLTAPTVSDNCPNNALSFDGVNDHITMGDVNAIDGISQMTIEAWVYRTNTSGYNSIVNKSVSQSANAIQLHLFTPNDVYFRLAQASDGYGYTTGNQIPINSWVHIAAVFDGTATGNANRVKIYINGVQKTLTFSGTIPSATPNTTAPLQIASPSPAAQYWTGKMDEVRIWTTARTSAQILSNFNAELNAQAGLLALYHFNQGVANGNNAGITSVIDASGNGLNGTLTNSALTGSTSNWVGGNVSSAPIVTNNAPATYPIGNTTVTWTATDASGNKATCEQVVTVNDNQPPVITCPANITNVVATSVNGAVVNYTAPVGTDNCTGALTLRTAGLASGATFPIGTTTVTHQVTDAAGLTAQCSFTVTVVGVAPVIACPANITVSNTAGQCGANVIFAATATGAPSPTFSYSPASGSFFPKGTTTVTATATNAGGSSSCTFTVTVNDNQPPTMVCAAPVIINTTPGLCTGTTTLTPPTVSDNCSNSNSIVSSNTVTYEAWIFPNGTQSAVAGIIFRRDGGNATGLNIGWQDPSRIGYSWNNDFATYSWTGGPQYVQNQWNHVALVIEPTKATIYLNGVPYVNNVANAVISLDGTTKLGVDNCCGSRFFKGSMDDVRIWNYARTQAEILASMNAELIGNEQGLVSYYKFNQGTAGAANAGLTSLTASKGNNGTLNNFALSGSSSNWATGKIANGLDFDGVNDFVDIGTLNLNTSSVTLTNNYPSNIYPIGNTTVTWTATDASGNTATCEQVVTVISNTNTAGAASISPAVCSNNAITNITHTTTGATGIGTATGLPNGVTAAFAANTITISGTPTESGTFNYSIPLTGGCGTVVHATGTITVSSPPTPGTIIGNTSICVGGNTLLNANATSGGSGVTVTSYQWFIDGNSISGSDAATYTATMEGSYTV